MGASKSKEDGGVRPRNKKTLKLRPEPSQQRGSLYCRRRSRGRGRRGRSTQELEEGGNDSLTSNEANARVFIRFPGTSTLLQNNKNEL
jgi:hypothetical protein